MSIENISKSSWLPLQLKMVWNKHGRVHIFHVMKVHTVGCFPKCVTTFSVLLTYEMESIKGHRGQHLTWYIEN